MKLFGSLRWDGGTGFFIGLRGGFEKHCTAGLAKAKDKEGQTTGVGHPRGM